MRDLTIVGLETKGVPTSSLLSLTVFFFFFFFSCLTGWMGTYTLSVEIPFFESLGLGLSHSGHEVMVRRA